MLVTLNEVKVYLGIDPLDTTYDAFLTELIIIFSESIEAYCNRKLLAADYVQTVECRDFAGNQLPLYHYPINSISKIEFDGVEVFDVVRVQKPSALLTPAFGTSFFSNYRELKITYNAGHTVLPAPIRFVIFSLIKEKYDKKVNGVDLSFGSDVQRISIPSVISIDYDYSLSNNDTANQFGMVLGNYINTIKPYRSERTMIGSAMVAYVE